MDVTQVTDRLAGGVYAKEEAMAELSEPVKKLLDEKTFWHLATVNPDGSPQVSPVWADERDGKIVVNTAIGRVKDKNMRREPRVALSATGDNLYEPVMVKGRVVETIEGDEAEREIDNLSEKYTGNRPYPWRTEGERRVTFVIEPTT
jgi:PPOX class probable F420-dependent enzyme